MPDKPLVLVIDDETGSRESMAIALEKAGLAVRTFDDARKALEFLDENENARLAVCDLRMPGMDGLGFLHEVRERKIDLGIMLVTAYGSIESAVEAMRVGADDYLTKPVDLYELRKRVMNLIEKQQLKEEVSTLREMLDKRYGFESIIGRSAPMERLFEQMRLVAPTRSSVLIIGESGTGKELVANALHRASPRRNERFLAINCGAIPSDILESELFGHERGAFTGAVTRKIGKFELAHRGTLFLDEISELYPELQVKLLRVLEERQVMRVGGSDLIDGRLPAGRGHQPRPREGGRRGALPRGPLLPAQGGDAAHPAAARAAGGHPAARRALPGAVLPGARQAAEALGAGGAGAALPLPLAGQRARSSATSSSPPWSSSQGDEITPADLPVEVRDVGRRRRPSASGGAGAVGRRRAAHHGRHRAPGDPRDPGPHRRPPRQGRRPPRHRPAHAATQAQGIQG